MGVCYKFKVGGFPTIHGGKVLSPTHPSRNGVLAAAHHHPPSLQIFRDGDLASPGAYEGPREEEGIVKYLKKQVGPVVEVEWW